VGDADQAAERPLRVFLCDDALGFPRLVASWLAREARFEYLGLAKSATELLEVVGGLAPDVVLLDFMLPEGQTSPELVAKVRALAPGARIVLISSLGEERLAEEARRTGADAHCPRATKPEAFLAVVAAQGRAAAG
jgi:DNA-binding NarL/FixJ family response regulator